MTLARRAAIVLFYLLIACLALDALIANFTTAMPGIVKLQASNEIQPSEFDIFFWNLWWVRHAIFDLHVSPLYTNFVVYPFVSPLAGHTLALLWGLFSAPFQLLVGLIPTFNGIVVLAFVLAGLAMYAFVRRHVQRASVALLAGLIFAFTPAMIQRASVGHLDKISIFWLPLCLLTWDKVIETRRWTWAVITGLCLYLAWLTDFQQTMWTLLLLGPYVITTLIKPRKREDTADSEKTPCLCVAVVSGDRAGGLSHPRAVCAAAAAAGGEPTQLSAGASWKIQLTLPFQCRTCSPAATTAISRSGCCCPCWR